MRGLLDEYGGILGLILFGLLILCIFRELLIYVGGANGFF